MYIGILNRWIEVGAELHLGGDAAAGVQHQSDVFSAHAEADGLRRHRKREVVPTAGRHGNAHAVQHAASRLLPSVDRDDAEVRAREAETAKNVRRVDETKANRHARDNTPALLAIAAAEQRHAVERVRER